MSVPVMPSTQADSAEPEWRAALVGGNLAAAMAVPVLRHLVAGEAGALCSEEIVARIRGMTRDIARQLLDRIEYAESDNHPAEHANDRLAALIGRLVESTPLLGHLHVQALEWQLVERLQAHLGIDPVLSPLLQTLVASQNPETSALAMRFLASQARHCQTQRRMTLPLTELPKDVLQAAMSVLVDASESDGARQQAKAAAANLRVSYDEAATRLALAKRLIRSMGQETRAALVVSDAGAALFVSALAHASGLGRDQVLLATNESQAVRLALALCAAGLEREEIESQFVAILPHIPFPRGLENIAPNEASSILAADTGSGQGI